MKEVPYTVNGKKVAKTLNFEPDQRNTIGRNIKCLKGGGGDQEDTKRSGGDIFICLTKKRQVLTLYQAVVAIQVESMSANFTATVSTYIDDL